MLDNGGDNPATEKRHDDEEDRCRPSDENLEEEIQTPNDAVVPWRAVVFVAGKLVIQEYRSDVHPAPEESEKIHHRRIAIPCGVRAVHRGMRDGKDGCLDICDVDSVV